MVARLGCLLLAGILVLAGAAAAFVRVPGLPRIELPPLSIPGAPLPPALPSNTTPATILRVLDGDTIEVRISGTVDKVRFLGINAPESSGQAECFSKEAATYLEKLLPAGSTVGLQRDVSDRDQFGRLLRYVWLVDGRLVNLLLVSEGYVQSSSFPPDVRFQEQILAAQRRARESGLGLWGVCQTDLSADNDAQFEFVTVRGAAPDGRATVTIRTRPGVLCSIRYVTPSGTESQASGLGNKEADRNGQIVWTWNIGPSTTAGSGTIFVSCGGATASTRITIE